MKKSLMVLAASALILFAACKKEENNGYTINGDKITFGVGINDAQNADKQSYNGLAQRIYFTTGDSIFVNGVDCLVRPQAIPTLGTNENWSAYATAEFSPYALITSDVSTNGSYEFVYPVKVFTHNAESDAYTTTFPTSVRLLNHAVENNDFNTILPDPQHGLFSYVPVWPMYYKIQNINTFEGNVVLQNACSFLAPRVRYAGLFAQRVFAPITGETYWSEDGTGITATAPALNVLDGFIISSIKMTGAAHLDRNGAEDGGPLMVMDDEIDATTGRDLLHFDVDGEGMTIYPVVEGQDGMNIVGMFPVAPAENRRAKSFQIALTMGVDINNVHYYIGFISNEGTTNRGYYRNERNFLHVDFTSTAFQETDPVYTNGIDNFRTNHGGEIVFNNGKFFISSNWSAFATWRNANIPTIPWNE